MAGRLHQISSHFSIRGLGQLGTGIHKRVITIFFLLTGATLLADDEAGWQGLSPELDGGAAGITITEARQDLRRRVFISPNCTRDRSSSGGIRNEVEARTDFLATSGSNEPYNAWWERCVAPADQNNVAAVRPTPTMAAPTQVPSIAPTTKSEPPAAEGKTPPGSTGGSDTAVTTPTQKPAGRDSLALLDSFLPKPAGGSPSAPATPSAAPASAAPAAQHFDATNPPASASASPAADADLPASGPAAASGKSSTYVDASDPIGDAPPTTTGVTPATVVSAPTNLGATSQTFAPSAPPPISPFSVTTPSGKRPDAVPVSAGMPPESFWGTRTLTSWYAPTAAEKTGFATASGKPASEKENGKKPREAAPAFTAAQNGDKKPILSTKDAGATSKSGLTKLVKQALNATSIASPRKTANLWSGLKDALKAGLKKMGPPIHEASDRTPASVEASTADLEAAFPLPNPVTSFLARLGDSTPESDPTGDLICSLLLILTMLLSLGGAVGLFIALARLKRRRAAGAALLLFAFSSAAHADVVSANRDLSAGEAASIGSAEGYGGGEILEAALNQTRRRAIEALDALSREKSEAWCDFSACASALDPAFCTPLRNLGDSRRKKCSAFLSRYARSLAAAAAPEASPFRVSGMPLTVTTAAGDVRAVAAITRYGTKQPIVFAVGSLKGLEAHAILALLVHELGHKLAPNERPITDDMELEAFSKGSELLDAVGVSVAAYAASHLPPVQDPPYLPEGVLARFCGLAHDPKGAFIVGLYADLQERLPTADEVASRSKELMPVEAEAARFQLARDLSTSEATRSLLIRDYFQRFLQRPPVDAEFKFHSRRLASAVPHFAVVASLIGNKEFARTRGIEDDTTFISVAFLETHGRQPTADEQKEAVAFLKRSDRATLASLWFQKPGSPATARWLGHIFQKLLNRAPTSTELAEARELFLADKGWEAVVSRILGGQEYLGLQRKRLSTCSVPTPR